MRFGSAIMFCYKRRRWDRHRGVVRRWCINNGCRSHMCLKGAHAHMASSSTLLPPLLKILIPTTRERRDRLEVCIRTIRMHTTIPHMVVVFENNLGGFVPAIHTMLAEVNGPVWCIRDDTVVVDDAIDRMYQKYTELYPTGNGAVQPTNEPHDKIDTMPLCDANTMRMYAYRGYTDSTFATCELVEIMTGLGLCSHASDCSVRHLHLPPPHESNTNDPELLSITLCKIASEAEIYRRRKACGFEPKNKMLK